MNYLITDFAFRWSAHELSNYIPHTSSNNYCYYQPSIESHKQKHINACHEKSKEEEDHPPHYLPERFGLPHSFFLFTWIQKLGVMATLNSLKTIKFFLFVRISIAKACSSWEKLFLNCRNYKHHDVK